VIAALRAQRHGNTRAVHPLLPDDDEPEGAPLTYEFREQLHLPATLYKARAPRRAHCRPGAARRGRVMRARSFGNPCAAFRDLLPLRADVAARRRGARRPRAATDAPTRASSPKRCC
jgi:hypothetical protein